MYHFNQGVKLKKCLIGASLLALSTVAFATECAYTHTPCPPKPEEPTPPEMVVTDTWKGKDKRDHFVVSTLLGIGARGFITPQPIPAWGLCMLPGLGKELYDARKNAAGAFSEKDLVANGLGCALGVAGTDMALTKEGDRYTLWLNVKF